MLYKTLSAAVYGIDAELVEVEVDLAPRSGDSQLGAYERDNHLRRQGCAGLPRLQIV